MTEQHPITPPPELVEQWIQSTRLNDCIGTYPENYEYLVATQAARWGADQQLLACGKYLGQCAAWEEEDVTEMYNYLRPRPPSLKEQSLALIDKIQGSKEAWDISDLNVVRRALESLPD